jgi:asparagine synthetase B (glutamine-hydrolysing)
MQIIEGFYHRKESNPITLKDYQINPTVFQEFEGVKLPINGPFTTAIASHGSVILYSSFPAEIPLYYSVVEKQIYWSEYKRTLPGIPHQVKPGTAVRLDHKKTVWQAPVLRPEIKLEPVTIEDAIAQYRQLLLEAVGKRLQTVRSGKIALSCSGGVDSQLIAWALLQHGVDFTPFTAATTPNAHDIRYARRNLKAMKGTQPVPILITKEVVKDCIEDAVRLYEDIGPTPKYMQQAVCHTAIARKLAESGYSTIFNGHGQDDIMGGLRGIYKEVVNLSDTILNAEYWRDERLRAFRDQSLAWDVNKLFSAIYRHYNVEVRMPYYDWDLMEWALSQRLNIIPIDKNKPFVKLAARKLLPKGLWDTDDYQSTGYTKGTGWQDPAVAELADFVAAIAETTFTGLFGNGGT